MVWPFSKKKTCAGCAVRNARIADLERELAAVGKDAAQWRRLPQNALVLTPTIIQKRLLGRLRYLPPVLARRIADILQGGE